MERLNIIHSFCVLIVACFALCHALPADDIGRKPRGKFSVPETGSIYILLSDYVGYHRDLEQFQQ